MVPRYEAQGRCGDVSEVQLFEDGVALRRFWFYGDDPVEERLRRLGSYLDTYEARTDIESLVPKQPLFKEPKKFVGYYAAGSAEVRPPAASACMRIRLPPRPLPGLPPGLAPHLWANRRNSPLAMKRGRVHDTGLGRTMMMR